MDDLQYNEDLLIRYLDGELNNQQKFLLEDRLKVDDILREKLINLRIAIEAIKQAGTTQQVAGIHHQMMQELSPGTKNDIQNAKSGAKLYSISKALRYTMAIAASILVLFIGYRVYVASQLSSEKLYDESFVDFNSSVSRGNATDFSQIEKYYQEKNYTAVISSGHSLHLSAKDSLLIGLSYLHTDKLAQAISFFQRLANQQNKFQEDAEFYLSLSYLKNKNYTAALPLMEKIISSTAHLYHKQFDQEFVEQVKELKEK